MNKAGLQEQLQQEEQRYQEICRRVANNASDIPNAASTLRILIDRSDLQGWEKEAHEWFRSHRVFTVLAYEQALEWATDASFRQMLRSEKSIYEQDAVREIEDLRKPIKKPWQFWKSPCPHQNRILGDGHASSGGSPS